MLESKSQAMLSLQGKGNLYPLDMTSKEFKDRLRFARTQAKPKLTQADLADALGVTPQAVSGWERGEAKPQNDKLNALGDLLKVNVEWLLGKDVPTMVPSRKSEEVSSSLVRNPTLRTLPQDEFLGRIDLPVFATANGGRGALVLSSEPYTHIARPHNLLGIKEGYGVLVKGNSMAREYNENDIAYVDPIRHPKKDDPCVFQGIAADGTTTAIIKYLDRSPDAHETLYYVYQTNPLKKFTIRKADWQTCNVLVGKVAGG
jgi:transcriptional regulator with XRE-family HTH domain